MNVKSKISHFETIRKILKEQNGLLLASELARFGIPRTYLSILAQNGEIERVSRGVYRTPSTMEDGMFVFQSIYKMCIFSHETALFLHDLTDRSPLSYSVSVPSGYHSVSLKGSGHKVFYVNRNLFDLGVVSVQSPHGNGLRATNLERTICDILRSRNKMDVQFLNTAFQRYLAKREKNIILLNDYAKAFHIQKIARQYVEVLL